MQIGDKWTNWSHALLMQHLNYNKCSYSRIAIEYAHTVMHSGRDQISTG